MSTETRGPTYNAYVVTKREGKEDWWTQVGSAFEHSDGKGLNLMLQALPITGADGECKIVLRTPKADDGRMDERPTRPMARQDGERRQARAR